MRLWLIRHGETEHNVRGVFQGQLDTSLTSRGVEQARRTAQALEAIEFDRVFSSDLERAYQTARPITAGRTIEVELDDRLRELHYGVLQGVAYSNFRSVLREHGIDAVWGEGVFSDNGDAPPGGESLDELVARITQFLDDLTGFGVEKNIAVVTHGGTIRSLMTVLLGLQPGARSNFSLANCGVTCFTGNANRWTLEFHNRVLWTEKLELATHRV